MQRHSIFLRDGRTPNRAQASAPRWARPLDFGSATLLFARVCHSRPKSSLLVAAEKLAVRIMQSAQQRLRSTISQHTLTIQVFSSKQGVRQSRSPSCGGEGACMLCSHARFFSEVRGANRALQGWTGSAVALQVRERSQLILLQSSCVVAAHRFLGTQSMLTKLKLY